MASAPREIRFGLAQGKRIGYVGRRADFRRVIMMDFRLVAAEGIAFHLLHLIAIAGDYRAFRNAPHRDVALGYNGFLRRVCVPAIPQRIKNSDHQRTA